MNTHSSIYAKSLTDGVWQRPDHGNFGYSDGDEVEDRIVAIMRNAQDRSVLSTELRASIQDWPTRYHLSPLRANILRPVESVLRGSVLEIGSGCGAITRYLGETAREVLALEGSRRRAHITRLRTRELNNVEVYCDEFSAFRTDQRFDAVTLIGVLEYAHMFIPGEQSALQMLLKARERLNDDGSLVIAIENQLGLKYFAGAPEDHLGKPMIGVEDRYLPQGVRTYGKQALSELLLRAGFGSVEFLFPFPDYKLPVSVLSEQALADPRFDPKPFLVLTAGKDPQLSDAMGFSLERAWPVIANNGLVADHANSFLVVARQAAPLRKTQAHQVLAWHFSTQRRPEYCKETMFCVDTADSAVRVNRQPMVTNVADLSTESRVRHVLQDETPYAPLPLLSSELIDLITRPGWTDRQLAEFLRRYARMVGHIGALDLVRSDQIRWDQAIPGDLFDCIPQNIRMHPDGSCSVFDLEWRQTDSITFLSLAFRSLWHTIGNLSLIGLPEHGLPQSLIGIIRRSLSLAGTELPESTAQDLVRAELELQQRLTGEQFDFDAIWLWLDQGTLRQQSVFQRLIASHQQNAVLAHQVNETGLAVAHWQRHADGLVREVQLREETLSDWQAHARNLTHSVSHLQGELAHCHQERDDAMNLFKSEQVRAIGARNESLESMRTVHRLSQQAAYQLLRRSSVRSLLQVARDHRSVVLRSREGAAAPRPAMSWVPQLTGYLGARNKLTVLSPESDHAQTARWIQQSCQWQFPFAWHFFVQDEAPVHSIVEMTAHLEIAASVSNCDDSVRPAMVAWLQSLPPNAMIALPRIVVAAEDTRPVSRYMPGGEDMRQAYAAMTCDRRISGIYVGVLPSLKNSGISSDGSVFLSLFRASFIRELPAESPVWRSMNTLSQLRSELDAWRQPSVIGRSRILVV